MSFSIADVKSHTVLGSSVGQTIVRIEIEAAKAAELNPQPLPPGFGTQGLMQTLAAADILHTIPLWDHPGTPVYLDQGGTPVYLDQGGTLGLPGSGRHLGLPGSGRHLGLPGSGRHVGLSGSRRHVGLPGSRRHVGLPGPGRHRYCRTNRPEHARRRPGPLWRIWSGPIRRGFAVRVGDAASGAKRSAGPTPASIRHVGLPGSGRHVGLPGSGRHVGLPGSGRHAGLPGSRRREHDLLA